MPWQGSLSTRAAARYLNDLFAMFKDWNLVLAAYNWGEGKVQRLIQSTGLNDLRSIGFETDTSEYCSGGSSVVGRP
jgi:membrane-bound lytic murein transglycosylase D